MFRFRRTVDSILSDINKSITRLHNHGSYQDNLAEDKKDQADQLLDAVAVHRKEADRAYSVASKLKDLIA